MKVQNEIYPFAYRLVGGQMCRLYYLAFPESWKKSLLDLARKSNPRFKDEHGLLTNSLKEMVESWVQGVISLKPLKKDSQDEHWLTSCHRLSDREIHVLYSMIQTWITATYISSNRVAPYMKRQAEELCRAMNEKELIRSQTSDEVLLTADDGTVTPEAYDAVPLLVVNKLLGQGIELGAETLHLCYISKNQLISRPICDPKSRHSYSLVFDFSMQTTPPDRKALLLCQMSIRRWIPGRFCKDNKDNIPYLQNSIHACIRIDDDKYCQVAIEYDRHFRKAVWKSQDQSCHDMWELKKLPECFDVLKDPEQAYPEILLPYKNGMTGFIPSKIGTGVSVIDKASLYPSISRLLGDMTADQPIAVRVPSKRQNFSCYKSPDDYGDREEFREWVYKCVGSPYIRFEIYGLEKDPVQNRLMQKIRSKLLLDFGENSDKSCLHVDIELKETGDLADCMKDDQKSTKIQRCDEILERIGRTADVTACIFLIPGQENYKEGGDPKQVIRNAFARSGRVVQFINPDADENSQKPNEEKLNNAVYDLYRQLGIVTLLNLKKNPPSLSQVPCVGMHVCTQIHGKSNKGRFLPVYIWTDVANGRVQVQCDAFKRDKVSYREACLEMAQLFWKDDLEQRCTDASRSPAKEKLLELKNHYNEKENPVLLIVQSDGTTRELWGGISDKEIGSYQTDEPYCPLKINVGKRKNNYPLSLKDTGVRIMRVRSNREVPDYFTGISEKSTDEREQRASASGIFKYGNVYWGIHPKPNDKRYTNSLKMSKMDHPRKEFAEKDMIEIYPIQLQSGDNPDEWVFYTNALHHIPIQYSQSTVLPLPLHLAKALEEYLFDA